MVQIIADTTCSLPRGLLRKVGGDRAVVDRLIAFERGEHPDAPRLACLQNAVRKWERENG